MEIGLLIISPVLLIFSLGMMITSLLSYKRSHNMKLLFVTLVFLFFFVKGVLLGLSVFLPWVEPVVSLVSFGVVDVLIVLLLFFATLKRF